MKYGIRKGFEDIAWELKGIRKFWLLCGIVVTPTEKPIT